MLKNEPCANAYNDPKGYADKDYKTTIRIDIFLEQLAQQIAWPADQKFKNNFEENISYEAKNAAQNLTCNFA